MNVMALWLETGACQGNTRTPGSLDLRSVGMMKSYLLGRLMRGEQVRERPCPVHKGRMWCAWGLMEEMDCCDGTGWLKNEESK